jgi:hypothetical protein
VLKVGAFAFSSTVSNSVSPAFVGEMPVNAISGPVKTNSNPTSRIISVEIEK